MLFLHGQHLLRFGQDAHDLQPNAAMSARGGARANSPGEIFTFQVQRLHPFNVRNGNLAIAIGDPRVGMHIGPFVVNLDHFRRIGVIIDHHSGIPDHRDAADLTGVKPAHVDVGAKAVGKAQIEMGDIVDVGLQMGMGLNFDLLRLFAQHIEQNREIMGRQVPDDVGIATKQA